MIVSSEQFKPAEDLHTGVCIIGAGAAGITLAAEFDGMGEAVIMLEAGGLKLDAAASDHLYGGEAGAPHPSPTEYRRVVFGGTTGWWGGRCVPFDPIDFEPRDYVSDSGWPITYEEVARHYPRAMDYCDAGEFDFSTAALRSPAPLPTIPGLVHDDVIMGDRIERYSLPTNFGTRYREKIAASANVTALLHARCVRLNRAVGQERIESVTIAERGGTRRRIRARVFILAVGGIEAARLLLASDPEGPGLGNRTDQLGRFYGCHFENTLGRLVSLQGKAAFDFERTRDGVYCRRKLQFTAQAQRRHRLLNCAFRLHFPSYSDASHGSPVLSGIYLAKSALIPEYRAILQHGAETAVQSPVADHLRNVVFGAPEAARFGYQWLFHRVLATRKLPYTLVRNRDGSYPLEFNSEQTPMASSRITLGDEIDRDGMRRVRVDWRLGEDDLAAARRAFLLLQEALASHSGCRVELDADRLEEALRRSVPLGGHHMGTTRMGVTARSGVVDADCAMFEAPNVYVASSSVFRTNSHANPTLTIVALALRLAERLKKTRAASSGGFQSRDL